MFQQPAITENLTAGRAHPPAADASAEDTSPAERDPFLDHYFRRIDPRVAASFSPEQRDAIKAMFGARGVARHRSEGHTSELQSLMRISYAVFCLKKKTTHKKPT